MKSKGIIYIYIYGGVCEVISGKAIGSYRKFSSRVAPLPPSDGIT